MQLLTAVSDDISPGSFSKKLLIFNRHVLLGHDNFCIKHSMVKLTPKPFIEPCIDIDGAHVFHYSFIDYNYFIPVRARTNTWLSDSVPTTSMDPTLTTISHKLLDSQRYFRFQGGNIWPRSLPVKGSCTSGDLSHFFSLSLLGLTSIHPETNTSGKGDCITRT